MQMKNSNINWLGRIPESWNLAGIKRLFTLNAGATPDSNNPANWDGDIIWVTPADFKTQDKFVNHGKRNLSQLGYDSCSATIVDKDSIIFSKRAPIGTVAICGVPLCTNQGCISCTPHSDASALFYYYYLSVCAEQFELYGSGTTFKEISLDNFANFKVALPPMPEQTKIANYLDSKTSEIESLIDNLNKQIESLKEYKKSLIYKCVTKGLDDSVPLKDSGVEWIGQIPESWHTEKLLNLLRCKITDGPHETPDLVDDGIPFVSVDSLNETEDIDFSVVRKFISEDDYNEYRKKTNLKEGDILFSKAATIGKTAIVKNEKFMIWSPLAIVKSDSSKCYNKYLYYVLNCDGLIKHIGLLGGYNTQVNVGMRSLECAPVPVPPLAYQLQITRFLDSKTSEIKSLIDNLNKLIESLKEYKKSLIYEYVTGKKEVV